jgi:5'(3')-deoxyribonucleotidase
MVKAGKLTHASGVYLVSGTETSINTVNTINTQKENTSEMFTMLTPFTPILEGNKGVVKKIVQFPAQEEELEIY